MQVAVIRGEYHGKPTLAIHEVKDGKASEKPVISFGEKKAKAIVAAMKYIEKFVEGEVSDEEIL